MKKDVGKNVNRRGVCRALALLFSKLDINGDVYFAIIRCSRDRKEV